MVRSREDLKKNNGLPPVAHKQVGGKSQAKEALSAGLFQLYFTGLIKYYTVIIKVTVSMLVIIV